MWSNFQENSNREESKQENKEKEEKMNVKTKNKMRGEKVIKKKKKKAVTLLPSSISSKTSSERRPPPAVLAPKCISCGRSVLPATMEGFEAHSKICPAGEECWNYAAAQNASDPMNLIDKAIELKGGLKGTVIGIRPHRLRRWLHPSHQIIFDSGREDTVQLDDTTGVGQKFRFLDEVEDTERKALNKKRLELELLAAKQHAADLEKAQIVKHHEISRVQRQLEESTLCAVCLDKPKSTALVPCGHRLCLLCASKFHQQLHSCPVCRRHVRSTLRVYN
uniref:RING-type domain-containing protein n=1 Tax=Aureoumbra lagunensis TaxID=44058 RepID=A0A7S3K3L9_9STRA|mmetsp:Transcript_3258/g.4518  ORF Transcript_3258/g.4518 Transcript_3258/m.4518 type:complete len:278 (+) Transcript_3258:86-919(+)